MRGVSRPLIGSIELPPRQRECIARRGGSQRAHLEEVCLLSDAGPDKDIAMQGGATPLLVASESGHLEVVCLLSDAGADKDIATQGGANPLRIASQSDHLEGVTCRPERARLQFLQ